MEHFVSLVGELQESWQSLTAVLMVVTAVTITVTITYMSRRLTP
jgi:hypothetical protein